MAEKVVVVGAGPVGMTLVLELARHGVESVLVDRKPGLDRIGSRAIVIARHTLEAWERLGCAAPVLDRAIVLTRARTFLRRRELLHVDFPPAREGELPRFVNLQQVATEAALHAAVRASPAIEVRFGVEVTGLRERRDRVEVAVRGAGGADVLGAAYAVGCDGARSVVRRLLAVPFPGRTLPDRFLVADVRTPLAASTERRLHFDAPFHPGRQVLIHPQPGGEWRIDWQVALRTDAEAERRDGRLERRIRRIIGDRDYELTWLTSYRFGERLAERFRVGRVFLAGDAAHLVAPFGARGMNSGVEDAANLAWKLAAVVHGTAPTALLDSYERERQAAARHNLRVAGATMRFMAPSTPARRALRDAILAASLPPSPVRRLVDSGRLAEPAVYGDGGNGVIGRPAPRGIRVERALSAGFTVVRVGGERLVVRPDGYVAARLEGEEDAGVPAALAAALGRTGPGPL